VLSPSSIVRARGPRTLFVIAATATAAILLWTLQMRINGNPHGLARIFFVLFAYEDSPDALCALIILVVALCVSRYLCVRRATRWAGDHPIMIAVITALLLALGTLTIYQNHPLSMDEYAAYFQSRVFAAGQLSGRFPVAPLDWLIPRGFQDYFLNVSRATGSVAEAYWPGFALLLAPFSWAGVPWLCNPVVSAVTLIVIHRLALELFHDREAAGFALMLTIASPVIFANGISYYSMPLHLLTNCLFALLLVRPTLTRSVAAGIVGSLALTLHNPVPHIVFAAPWLLWIATRDRGVRLFAALIAGYLPLVGLLGIGWFLYSGHLLHEGLASVTPAATSHRLEQMIRIFALPDSRVVLARLVGIAKIWVWAVPGLLILAAVGAIRWRREMFFQLFAASALLTLFGYFLVPVDQGHGWGYRYFHSAWMALPLLATAALFVPAGVTNERGSQAALFEDDATKSFVAACVLLTLIFGVGLRAWQLRNFLANDLRQVPQYEAIGKRIVILDDRYSFYGADLVQNDPWLRGDEIRMYSHGLAADEQMMAHYYPEFRKVYTDRYGTVWSRALPAPSM
jgi:hypothetical protein